MKKTLLILLTGASLLSAADGMKIYGAKCAECHGADGKDISVSGKAIAGNKGTLAKLQGYKNGSFGGEQKATMQGSIADVSEADLQSVAAYVDGLK